MIVFLRYSLVFFAVSCWSGFLRRSSLTADAFVIMRTTALVNVPVRPRRVRNVSVSSTTSELQLSSFSSDDARQLLYQDQQNAMLQRSQHEEQLLLSRTTELKAPTTTTTTTTTKNLGKATSTKKRNKRVQRAAGGTGFGKTATAVAASSASKEQILVAQQQAEIIHRDGVLRIDNALTPELTDSLRAYILEQQRIAKVACDENPSLARSFYGVEQARAQRCDLQLSLLRGGYAADDDDDDGNNNKQSNNSNCNTADKNSDQRRHVLADALQELLGANGSLRALYEALVTSEGEFYELAAVVTNPGSNRQVIHPDLPFNKKAAPLYVIFLALQDVTAAMGPTSFLIGTQTAKENAKFNSGDPDQKDQQLSNADCRLSTLQKGDAVVFDARILHCGNANDVEHGSTRALFNFSFRNPQVTGNLGYDGSIRPGYCKAMTLGDVGDALAAYEKGDMDPFAMYGSGLL